MSGVLGGNSAKNKRRNPEDSHEDGNEASAQNAQSPHVEQNMLPQSQSVKDPNQPSYSSMAQTESELESTQSQRENPGGLNTAEKPEQGLERGHKMEECFAIKEPRGQSPRSEPRHSTSLQPESSTARPAKLARYGPRMEINAKRPRLQLCETDEMQNISEDGLNAISSTTTPPHAPTDLSDATMKPLHRPDRGGRLGQKINLRVNFLPVKLPEIDIHHYHTEIIAKGFKSGQGYTKREAPMIIQCMVDQYQKSNPNGPKLVNDMSGQNVYCKSTIPGIEKSREYPILFTMDNGKKREYIVKIKWVSKVSLYDLNQALQGNRTRIPHHAIQAVEVVLRHLPKMTSIPVGDSFFNYSDGHEKDLGFGVQVWNGTFLSIRPTQWKMMMLNVDTCSVVFHKAEPVLKFLCDFFKLSNPPRRLDEGQIKKFNNVIKDVKIETTHIKRKQKVSGVSTRSARNETFDSNGTEVSVFDYFKHYHHITLEYPDLPCLKLGRNGVNIPMELCNIRKGERYQRDLTKEQLLAMIKHTALPAPERQKLIKDLIRRAKFDEDEFLADFGIKVGHDMPRLTGRVLDPPMIEYAQCKKELPRNGAWNMQHKYYKTVDLKEWAIVSYESRRYLNDADLDKFIHNLVRVGKDKGLSIHPSPCYRKYMRGSEGIGRLFEDLYHQYPNLQLLVIILPGNGTLNKYYEAVKYYGDITYGIRTQVIKSNTAARRATYKDTLANICLKINAKLGGTTSILEKKERSQILSRPVIIFGADVTHPSPGDVSSPSIAAVVASMDAYPNHYSAEVRIQERRKEIITDLKEMVQILLKRFRAATGAKPEKIIFYRDGVSEGQFKDVLLHELRAIQLACYDLHEGFKPAITFIVVKKRHHTRFFAENREDQCGKSKNIPPGTVVDTGVCHPHEFDWYLCSHAGIQGTIIPAHYHVLYDDSNFASDQLQTLSNELCHTYVRCARAVSIPAPAYYAHHVAFRARYHLEELKRNRGQISQLSSREVLNAVKINERMTNTMYFA